ncbi:MAG: SH3 domain-containing protein [Leptolyngbyaceae bacterium]|nr:SH3 domain-containing protein [Leptolyngbyaceae bacterium]
MSWSGFLSLIVGFLLAIALLLGGAVAGARFFMIKLTAPPPKPIFANDNPKKPPPKSPTVTNTKPAMIAQPSATPKPKPSLAPGSYKARVVSSIGLVLRDNPSFDAGQIGGIDFNEPVIVLEESSDKIWQKVRVEGDSAREGWVKAGNTKRAD